MKISLLLAQRQALLEQLRLANLAFAHAKLSDLAARIARAGLRGAVTLRQPTPEAELGWTPLLALEANQSVIEEHFTDEDLTDFADTVAFLTGETNLDVTFRIEEMADRYIAPLRQQLEQAGVTFDHPAAPVAEPQHGDSSG
jgi:hypothetical protein